MNRIRLTDAQLSALECRDGGGLDPATVEAWQGRFLVFEDDAREQLWDELNEASNAEEEFGLEFKDKAARRAGRSLCCLASKVLMGGAR